MKKMLQCLLFCVVTLGLAAPATAQWECLYATWDDDINGTGNQTPSFGLISEDVFVALVTRYNSTGVVAMNYLIPYVNADSGSGRLYTYGYGSATNNVYQAWTDQGFDQLQVFRAMKMTATPDSFLYVANNDPNHNILVFKFRDDTVTVDPVDQAGTVFPRQETGPATIWGLCVDNAGYVYVSADTATGLTDDIKVYPPIAQWTAFHTDAPVTTIDLPDGVYKGLAVSPDGTRLFVSDYGNRRVLKFTGSPAGGYTRDLGFNFELGAADTIPGLQIRPSVMGLAYLSPNNILAVACHVWGRFSGFSDTYPYGRIYFLDARNGAFISPDTAIHMMDIAAWNFQKTGGYSSRTGGTIPGNASGYTSNFDVAFDEAGNLYTACFYGWTVEKWKFNGTLPTFPVTDVAESPADVPSSFSLSQNYPNPFNPATTIEFTVPQNETVTLKVFDMLGRQVATLADGVREAGVHRVVFEPRAMPSGTYIYELRAGTFRAVQRMMLLK